MTFFTKRPSVSETLYTVTQLATELGVTARTVRFYEDKGLLTPQRAGNTRIFAHRDKVRLILILRGKRLGFSLREIKEYLDLYAADPTQREQWRDLLKKVQGRIDQLVDQQKALIETLGELEKLRLYALAGLDDAEPDKTRRAR
ncbi:DNA-binding transcriptional MerR regulator [Methylobacterium sp. PvP062]|jgi:DNA-binding transcriptional MerR regulator|uniref:DNA-binding transcriptional MerR regulator n=1 Tax=Methylobacterium radiotolerans TaxID=31998 RepID=A0ABV2NI46_9HYPH|nr:MULTISPECIES: MerR family DNA-binding transcriptional regulator [Methylobacterium]MBK3406066.1 MerR family DNA-binding transcriptional regulator [Methylorubrum rhodesianum]MBY0143635.1 MerR family DNA-binding transcriptional regulator [Methylorubrum populi]MCX7333930.1 MerR family DNA-binding transcriptional regulator [Hyphomicrobiales bacterium]MCY4510464.1 MerR family DNA-binding transcriptional regulator [Acidobacteriota bacterium]KIU30520.1 MerR family transcriptional regulator [Methylo